MTPTEYIKLAKLTDVPNYSNVISRASQLIYGKGELFHMMLGIASESGEVVDAIKKYLLYGKELDLVNLDEEMGDLLWYIAIYLSYRDKTFEEIMEKNIAKLKTRYPNKFTSEDALNRNLEAERKVLE